MKKWIFLLLLFTIQFKGHSQFNSELTELVKKAKKYKKKKNKIDEANTYLTIGNIYYNSNDYSSSTKYLIKAKNIFQKKKSQEINLLKTYLSLSKSYEKQQKNKKNIKILIDAKAIAIKNNLNKELIYCYQHLALTYKKNNDLVKYREYVNYINAFDKSKLNKQLSDKLITLQIDLENTEFELHTTTDSLLEYEARSALQSLQIKIYDKEIKLKHAEIETKNAVLKEQKANLKIEKIYRFFLIIGILGALLLGGVFFYNYKQKKKDLQIIAIQKDRITDSINYAKTIQNAMLPKEEAISKFIENIFILFKPKDIVSGDFYWHHQDPNNDKIIYLAAADCTGHGVPGAFTSMIGMSYLNEIISNGVKEVDDILNNLHDSIYKSLNSDGEKHGMDISLCKIDFNEKTIDFSGARNPLVKICNNEIEVLIADKKSIGDSFKKRKKVVEETKFTKQTTSFNENCSFYIFSDGYVDQIGFEKNEKFMKYNFYELLLKVDDKSFAEKKQILTDSHNQWKGDIEQLDDILVIGFKLS